jgi:hypothetical protein
MIGVANYLIQLGVRNNGHLALAHGNDAIGQCLEHVGVQITKIARQMESGDLSIARFEDFLPGTETFQKNGAKINPSFSGNDGFPWGKRLDARNSRDNPILLFLS